MLIDFDAQKNKFIISQLTRDELSIVQALPERRYLPKKFAWCVPPYRANLKYMREKINNKKFYSAEAYKHFTSKYKHTLVVKKKEKFPVHIKLKKEALKHQQEAVDYFFANDEVALFFKPGQGKTFTALLLAAGWYADQSINAVLVTLPSNLLHVWTTEIRKLYSYEYDMCVMRSNTYRETKKFIEKPAQHIKFLIVGIESLSRGRGISYVYDFLSTHSCAFIVDESTCIKTHNAQCTKNATSLAALAKKRMILTGTSHSEGLENTYAQYAFLNRNIFGYSSYYNFRYHFCKLEKVRIRNDALGNAQYVAKICGYKNQDEYYKLIKPFTVFVSKASLDLPAKQFEERYLTLSSEQKKLYVQMKNHYAINTDQGEHKAQSILERNIRLQQITSGFYPIDTTIQVYDRDGNYIDKKNHELKVIANTNAKLQELIKIYDATLEKIVVWCYFKQDVELITDYLQAKNLAYVTYTSSNDYHVNAYSVERFQNNEDVKFFIGTQAGMYGITLHAASTVVYYAKSYQYETYEQSQDRVHRVGQTKNCKYINLLYRDTIDINIHRCVTEKMNLAQYLDDQLDMNLNC